MSTATTTCNVLYSEGHGRIVWRVKVHPTATRKDLEQRLRKFSPQAKFIDYYYGELNDQQIENVVDKGRFPHGLPTT